MISFARIFALAGVILLGIGAFLPMNKVAGVSAFTGPAPTGSAAVVTELDCTHTTVQSSWVAVDCFSDDAEQGFLSSTYGFVLLGVALFGLLVVLNPRVGRLWTLAFTALTVVGVMFAYFNALSETNAVGDMDWGWGVLGGGVLLLLLSAFIGTIRAGARA